MKLYLTFKDVPEFLDLSNAERRRVNQACYRQAFKSRHCLAAFLIWGLCAVAGSALGNYLPLFFGFEHSIWQPTMGGVIGSAVGGFIWGQIVTDFLRPFYADYIKTELRRVVA